MRAPLGPARGGRRRLREGSRREPPAEVEKEAVYSRVGRQRIIYCIHVWKKVVAVDEED